MHLATNMFYIVHHMFSYEGNVIKSLIQTETKISKNPDQVISTLAENEEINSAPFYF